MLKDGPKATYYLHPLIEYHETLLTHPDLHTFIMILLSDHPPPSLLIGSEETSYSRHLETLQTSCKLSGPRHRCEPVRHHSSGRQLEVLQWKRTYTKDVQPQRMIEMIQFDSFLLVVD